MLGLRLSVNILGIISEKGVYSGYAYVQGKRVNVIVISKISLTDMAYGTVIAIANEGTSNERLILSVSSTELYEPNLREILSCTKSNLRIDKLLCLYEKSCGAVVCAKYRNDVKILLVKNHNGKYWSFPKGHIEIGENEKQTAIREIKEETDIDIKIMDGFRETSEYCPYGKIRKRVVFFIGIASSTRVKIQQNEIDCYNWTTFAEASRVCSYPNDLRVLEKAQTYLKERHIFPHF